MLIKQYVSTSDSVPKDVDLVNEFSTVPRATIHGEDDVEDQISVKYSPDEFVNELVEEDWDREYRSPIETTVMIVGEDEIIDRETVLREKSLSKDVH